MSLSLCWVRELNTDSGSDGDFFQFFSSVCVFDVILFSITTVKSILLYAVVTFKLLLKLEGLFRQNILCEFKA